MLLWILAAVGLVSIISLIGIVFIGLKARLLDKLLLFFVSFAAGGLLGGAFFHALPEAAEAIDFVFIPTLVGILAFFLLEKVLRWRHCHMGRCPEHSFGWLNLIGDGIHNFVDGVIIAAAFMISPELGLATTIAVVLHEIPQEIGDFSILLYAGFSRKKALMLNFATALTAFAGAIATYILATSMTGLAPILLAFAAGGFIYIATTDLMPELHKHVSAKVSIAQIIVLLCGLLLLYLIKI